MQYIRKEFLVSICVYISQVVHTITYHSLSLSQRAYTIIQRSLTSSNSSNSGATKQSSLAAKKTSKNEALNILDDELPSSIEINEVLTLLCERAHSPFVTYSKLVQRDSVVTDDD